MFKRVTLSPLTGSFILPQATYSETSRVKGCLLTRKTISKFAKLTTVTVFFTLYWRIIHVLWYTHWLMVILRLRKPQDEILLSMQWQILCCTCFCSICLLMMRLLVDRHTWQCHSLHDEKNVYDNGDHDNGADDNGEMAMVIMTMTMVTMVMVTNDNSDDDLFWRGGEHIPSQQMEISRLL